MPAFLASINGNIELQDMFLPALQRVGDSYIMDRVLAHANFKPGDIKAINWCRLYLGVVTVADISNAAGTQILHSMYIGMQEATTTTTN